MQIELPHRPKCSRRQFRRTGLARSDEAEKILGDVRALLDLAPRDKELTLRIADLIDALPVGDPIPEPKDVVRRLRASRVDGVEFTVADYLDDWIAGRRGLSPGTIYSYTSHIDVHLKPQLGAPVPRR